MTSKQNKNYFFRITQWIKKPYVFSVWAMLAILSYFFLDQKLAIYMHYSLNPKISYIGQIITHFGYGTYYIIGFFILFIASKYLLKWPRLTQNSLFLFLSVTIPGIICDIIKVIAGRARPVQLFQHHIYGFHFFQIKASMLSFPSGHATTITGLMMALSFLYPKYWPGFFVIALLVSFSRVVVTAHYLSDAMMGMYLGAFSVIYIYEKLYQHQRFSQLCRKTP